VFVPITSAALGGGVLMGEYARAGEIRVKDRNAANAATIRMTGGQQTESQGGHSVMQRPPKDAREQARNVFPSRGKSMKT
jgi:hypothetical protein